MSQKRCLPFSLSLALLFVVLLDADLSAIATQSSPFEKSRAGHDVTGDLLPQGAVARMGTIRLRHTSRVINLAYSPDAKLLATVGDDELARLWDPETGREIRKLSGHQGGVECVAFSPDGKQLATGSFDKTIRL